MGVNSNIGQVQSTDDIDIYIGKRIRNFRIEQGLSQAEVAIFFGVSYQQVQKYEKGTNHIRASRLWRFCDALGICLYYFFPQPDEIASAIPDRGRE